MERWKKLVVVGVLLALAGLFYPLYRYFYINGLRAEARVMLTYLFTLEQVYRTDAGHYVFFSEPYGANRKGQSSCQQPEGAKTLGFYLRWCHEKEAGREPILYAYRVDHKADHADGYVAQAESGTDETGASFICFGEGERDVWRIDEKKNLVHAKACTESDP